MSYHKQGVTNCRLTDKINSTDDFILPARAVYSDYRPGQYPGHNDELENMITAEVFARARGGVLPRRPAAFRSRPVWPVLACSHAGR